MNTCNLSGKLVRNAIVNGNQDRAMVFTLLTKYGYNPDTKKDRVSYVPCVVFNPGAELAQMLTERGKGIFMECEGRVSSSSYEVEGQTRFKTEVVVRNGTVEIVTR